MLSILDIVKYYMDESGNDGSGDALSHSVSNALGTTLEGRRFWVAWEGATIGDVMVPLTEGIHRLFVPMTCKDENGGASLTFQVCSQWGKKKNQSSFEVATNIH